MTPHWLVAGVGRSGTTAIYEALQSLVYRRRERFNYFYEPYLWGPPTWGPRFRAVAKAFTTTSSIHAHGLQCHLETPLFASEAEERSARHKDFIDSLFEADQASIVKIIRGCGRLKAYLEWKPEVKVIFVMRNPLDCVNSVLGNFSFFGDEFHPSDLPRFRRELESLGRPQPAFGAECEAATAWWYEMNQAALRGLEGHRERVFIAPYEAYTSDHRVTLDLLAKFLSRDVKVRERTSLDRPVGQITTKCNLRADDRDHIAPFHAAYFDLIEQISDIPIGTLGHSMAEKTMDKYRDIKPGAFAPTVPRDASPLRVRALLGRGRQARLTAAADIRRACADLRRAEAELSKAEARRP